MASNSTKTKREFMNALKDHMCNISFFVESWFKQSSHHWLNLDMWYMNIMKKVWNENYLPFMYDLFDVSFGIILQTTWGILKIVCNTTQNEKSWSVQSMKMRIWIHVMVIFCKFIWHLFMWIFWKVACEFSLNSFGTFSCEFSERLHYQFMHVNMNNFLGVIAK